MRAILRRLFSEKGREQIKELVRYGIVGLTTTLVNLAVYHILQFFLDYRIANGLALIASKSYGYFANKLIVFRSRSDSVKELVGELMRFVFARGMTAVVDFVGLILSVEVLGFDRVISKYVIQIIVIIMNYVLGKFVVFRIDRSKRENCDEIVDADTL